jgi:lytic murein transglycosylase
MPTTPPNSERFELSRLNRLKAKAQQRGRWILVLGRPAPKSVRQCQSKALAVLKLACIWLTIVAAASLQASAQPDATALDIQFSQWIENVVWPGAQASGVSRSTFDSAFEGVVLDLDLPELLLPERDNNVPIDQAEFRSPDAYFNEASLRDLARIGREELRNWASTLAAIEAQYGVPRAILLAILARESAFGRASIPHDAVTALAIQAFLGRRATKFLAELLAALQILQAGDVSHAEMRSSWAGGLGMPQFLPSTFLSFAVDFDNNGRRYIWRSVPDALASIANYLSQYGWNPDLDWGEHIDVPPQISCTLEGPHQGLSATTWEIFGIEHSLDAAEPLYLLMPAGRIGPGFLVTDNFYVLKAYNQSDLYALFVGHLADRINGRDTPFPGEWLPINAFTHDEIQRLQTRLEQLGYDVGGADGLIGYRTRITVDAVQSGLGLAQTCFPDRPIVEAFN